MPLRIRQIVLAARDLDRAVQQAHDTLGLQVVYRDPGVEKFGLVNALMPIGDQFLEIVSPTRADTAAGRHLERHGDSAYMLILQTDDLDRERARLERLGVRIVFESTHSDMRAVHLHPKDIGAAIVSLDEATPPSSWRWAGPQWRPDPKATGKIVDATIASPRPAALAERWASVLGLEQPRHDDDVYRLDIDGGALTFVLGEAERIVEFGVQPGPAAGSVGICGTRFVSSMK
jgi:catechol 2,3-dioxygenase-like lactoylglutathione lyase family enzyme